MKIVQSELLKLNQLLNRRDKLLIGILLLCMILGGLLEIIGIGAIPVFVTLIAYPEKITQYLFAENILALFNFEDTTGLLFTGSLALLVLYILKNGFLAFNIALQSWFTKRLMIRLAKRLFKVYMQSPYDFHLQRNTSELLRNSCNETTRVGNSVLTPLLLVCLHGIMSISVLGFLLYTELVISLATMGLFLLFSLSFYGLTQKKTKQYAKKEQEHQKIAIQSVQQGLGIIKEARILNREAYFESKFEDSTIERATAMRFREIATKLTQPLMEIVAVGGLLSLLILLIIRGKDIQSIIAMLAMFAVALNRLRSSIGQVVIGFTNFRYNAVSVNPVYDDLTQLESKVNEMNNGRGIFFKPVAFKKKVEIKKLYYRYPGENDYALSDINFTIQKGESIGFVGSTGAGKTTLIDVLLGLLEPEKGDILIDGKSIKNNTSAWQRNIGYIPQLIYLLDDTIRRNIALGLDDADIDENKVLEAIRSAQIYDFIMKLPNGLDTVIGEQGIRLSGGQRQRIGIARALYNNPEVLIMDEATSALDNSTEELLIKSIDDTKQDRTIIMIAHRLSTVQDCDILYFMKNGRIENFGTYKELIDLSDDFKSMIKSTKTVQ
jgi:ATP-binding cassette, subfamily B, bacterial PglK